MNRRDETERRLGELFAEARRADRAATPPFERVLRRARASASRRRAPWRGPGLAAMTAAAALTVIIGALWLWVERPEALRVPPTAVVPAGAVRPAEAVGQDAVSIMGAEPIGDDGPGEAPAVVAEQAPPVEPDAAAESVVGSPEPPPPSLPLAQVEPEAPTEPAEAVERVRVVAKKKVVDFEDTNLANKYSDRFVQDLPAPGRFYVNVFTLAPGPRDADGDDTPNAHGSRRRDYKTEVDGVANVDPLTGRWISRVNPNSIEEMEVITAGDDAELSRAQGGFAQVVQRQGGNGPAKTRPEPAEADRAGACTESYDPIRDNPFRSAADHPLSTFSIDVDTASYSNVRRFLRQGQLPPPDAVRIEEMVNYFRYDYPAPDGSAPFSADVEVADCPWNLAHRLARIGLEGREISRGEIAGSNLVFLIDVSGSMEPANKLPLLRSALSMLVDRLDGKDEVAIVVYAGASGLVLPPTPGSEKATILDALDRLEAGGSTNGGAGLELAYRIARERFVPGGVNRVILATDGDFNVGTSDRGTLVRRVERGARDGIAITALGFGMGDYKDSMLETLADRGNGNYAYIDDLREARKVLVEQIGGTLVTIAKDVKIQVEFNPARVEAYRLIGYENRVLAKEDFNDDSRDAGEIGAGHTVTALYEIVPAGSGERLPEVDPPRYRAPDTLTEAAASDELMLLKLRYKEPDGETSRLLRVPVVDGGLSLAAASTDFKFAAAVAQLGMILRDSPYRGTATLESTRALALEGLGPDPFGHRAEFLNLLQ